MKLSRVGVDLAKNVDQLHGVDRYGKAICEAMSRPHMRFVTVKSVDQQDIQATHQVRTELKDHRNAKANQIRGLVGEYGLVAPQTLLALRRAIPEWLEDAENGRVTSKKQGRPVESLGNRHRKATAS